MNRGAVIALGLGGVGLLYLLTRPKTAAAQGTVLTASVAPGSGITGPTVTGVVAGLVSNTTPNGAANMQQVTTSQQSIADYCSTTPIGSFPMDCEGYTWMRDSNGNPVDVRDPNATFNDPSLLATVSTDPGYVPTVVDTTD